MKTATALLRSAESIGIVLWVEDGQLRYKARRPVSDGFKNRIREHKADIITLLAAKSTQPILPGGCNSGCDHHHLFEGVAWCCWEKDETHWRRERIDRMNGCPKQQKKNAVELK